ncbi:hypothetical protein [Streptomyces sp. NPDC047000]|uniref:hypothetical protein n=1 Tax=Streptomyces sp. NPDC047000 TaxID=3155474 RepID=UPI0033C378A4
MTAGWLSRTVRAAVFAAVCVLLAALGHVMMSGAAVPAGVTAAATAVTGAAGWALAGRERGLPLIVAVVVAAQTALHTAFSLAQPGAPAVPTGGTPPTGTGMSMNMGMGPDMGSMPMTPMDPHVPMAPMPSAEHMDHLAWTAGTGHAGSAGGAVAMTLGMFAAHLLAALLTGVWLAYGERAAFRVLRAVAGRLAAPLRLLLALPAVPDRPRCRPRRPRSDRAPGLLLLADALTSRGPPTGTAVV